MDDFVYYTVFGCSGCGKTHLALKFRSFDEPVVSGGVEYDRWATCPETNKIILSRPSEVIPDDQVKVEYIDKTP